MHFHCLKFFVSFSVSSSFVVEIWLLWSAFIAFLLCFGKLLLSPSVAVVKIGFCGGVLSLHF